MTPWIKSNSRKATALVLVFAYPPAVVATSIGVFVRTDRIVIATDSMSSITKGGGVKRIKICKVYRTGTTFFAFAGLDQDDTTGYVASHIAEENGALGVRARATQFKDHVQKPLLESLQRAYRASPVEYRKFFPGKTALEALFADMENGGAVFYVIGFIKVEDANGRPLGLSVQEHSCPGSSCPTPGQPQFIWLGENDAISAGYRQMVQSKDARLHDDAATLKHLVELEIRAHPEDVGPPVAVLTIDQSGGYWNVAGCCNATKKKATPKQSKKQ